MEKLAKVYFRTDGNSEIGLGHVMRCLALADMIRPLFECVFLQRNTSQEAIELIEKRGYAVVGLPQEEEEILLPASLVAPKGSVVVLDGYTFTSDLQLALKRAGFQVVCIDDFVEGTFYADLIINHAGGVSPSDYQVDEHTRLALGPDYTLVHQAFLGEKRAAVDRNRTTANLLVCFGGADPLNLSAKVANELLESGESLHLTVIIGAANPHKGELVRLFQHDDRVTVLTNLSPEEMANQMRRSDWVIVPASGIAYEAASLNVPLYCVKYAANQEKLFRFLVGEGLAVGQDTPEPAISIPSAADWVSIQKRQAAIFDGKSPKRFRSLFVSLGLDCRKATAEDVTRYFEWANDPQVRSNSLNSAAIEWQDHVSWFNRRIIHPDHVFYVITSFGTPIGQVRIDFKEEEAIINYSLAKDFRGLGLGVELLRIALNELVKDTRPGIGTVSGVVKKENVASLEVFRKLGFEESENNDIVAFTKRLNHV